MRVIGKKIRNKEMVFVFNNSKVTVSTIMEISMMEHG